MARSAAAAPAPAPVSTAADAGTLLALDERGLVHTLKTLRALVDAAYALEVDRAAATPPWAYDGAESLAGQAARGWRFYAAEAARTTTAQPMPRVGASVEIVDAAGGECLASGNVVAASAAAVTVQLTRPQTPGRLPARGCLRLRVDDNQHTLRLQAIERIVRDRHHLPWVGPLLAGGTVQPLAESGWEPPADSPLVDGQARALQGATRTRDVFLVQGPPGTGKTTVIAELVRYFVGECGDRVLLCAQGHRAIDNALDRLARDAADVCALRLGQAVKVSGAGEAALLSSALSRVAETAPTRHAATQRAVRRAADRLADLDSLLAQLEPLAAALSTAEQALATRLAEIEATFAPALADLESAPEAVLRQRRAALVRADLLALREHVQVLREDHARVALWLDDAAADVRSLLPHVDLASLAEAGDPRRVRAARAAVDLARRRVAHLDAAASVWGEVVAREDALGDVVIGAADVVAATTLGVTSGRDGARTAQLAYDVAIVDEAGQAPAMDLLVALSRARTVILVGDHQQLPPFVDEDLLRRCTDDRLDTTWLTRSLFERLWDHLPPSHRVRLNLQFRMPAAVADALGQAFYEGDYASVPAKRDTPPVVPLFRAPVVFVDTSDAADRAETPRDPGYANACEAELLAQLAARLPAHLRDAEDGLGVIAPYTAQAAALRARLAPALDRAPGDPWLQQHVATVDSFQGQEREVLLVSLTRSNPRGAVGFVRDLQRLNVTLSRARQQLVVVGDVSTLTAARGPEAQPFVQFMRNFVWHLRTHGEVLTVEEVRQRLATNDDRV